MRRLKVSLLLRKEFYFRSLKRGNVLQVTDMAFIHFVYQRYSLSVRVRKC